MRAHEMGFLIDVTHPELVTPRCAVGGRRMAHFGRPIRGLVALLLAGTLLGLAAPASARRVIQDDTTQCLAEFKSPPGLENGGTLECNDCDPSCDQDKIATANGSC